MKKGDYLKKILRSNKTVFSTKEIALLWGESGNAVRSRLSYYVKKGDLKRVRKGFYAKDDTYNPLELSVKIYTPSYISFETVLTKKGVVFQYYDSIFAASYLSRKIKVNGNNIVYKKLKDSILFSDKGLEKKDNYTEAKKERAFLDSLYISGEYYFDNLDSLDWKLVFEILPIYENQKMEKRVNIIYKNVKKKKA